MKSNTIPKNRLALGGLLTLISSASVGNQLHAQTSHEGGAFALYASPGTNPTGHKINSDKYIVKVRKTQGSGTYVQANVLMTELATSYTGGSHITNQRYYENVWGCSHSYLNFEMNGSVDIEVSLSNNGDIDDKTTTIRPAHKVTAVKVSADKKKLTFTMPRPCNVAIDINGAIADRAHTNNAPAAHSLSIHGNPEMLNKPGTGDANVTVAEPGGNYNPNGTPKITGTSFSGNQAFRDSSTKTTLYFAPGIHYLGENFKFKDGKSYYIPGDAIVFGTFNNTAANPPIETEPTADSSGNENIRVFGHGTISGGLFNHWEMSPVMVDAAGNPITSGSPYEPTETDKNNNTDAYKQQQYDSYRKNAVEISGCENTLVEGISIVNPANHSLKLFTGDYSGVAKQNEVKWVKIFAWRANSDGAGINDASEVHDCFYRVQDDGYYPKGIALRDCVLWSDSNGVPLRLSALHNLKSRQMLDHIQTNHLRVEGIDVIFRRNMNWSHSASIELPIADSGNIRNERFIFGNINLSDNKTQRPGLDIRVQNNGNISNVRFENMVIPKMSTAAGRTHHVLYAESGGTINNLHFHNLLIGGQLVTSANWSSFFKKEKPEFDNGGNFTGWTAAQANSVQTPTFSDSKLTIVNPAASSGNAASISDATSGTMWQSGAVQSNNQWVRLSLNNSEIIDKIVLDQGNAEDDYPRGYEVFVSANATAPAATDTAAWGEAVTSGGGTPKTTVISFSPQKAKHILIRQNGVTSFNWWSITDAYVFKSDAIDRTGWTPTTNSYSGANALDGKASTRWDSSGFQSPTAGQFFQIDMGSNQFFDKIVLDTAGSMNDFPRGYVVKAGTTSVVGDMKVIATGKGFGPTTMITSIPTNARYIRIEQTGTQGSKFWSIHEMNVYKSSATPPSGWTVNGNIGGASGSFLALDAQTWNAAVASGDINNSASDSMAYAFQTKTNSGCTLIAKIVTIDAQQWFAKSGLMMRQSIADNSSNVFLGFISGGTLRLQTRNAGVTSNLDIAVNSDERFLKLVKSGNTFTAYASNNLNNFGSVRATVNVTFSGSYLSGIAVSSQNTSTPYTKFSETEITNVSNN